MKDSKQLEKDETVIEATPVISEKSTTKEIPIPAEIQTAINGLKNEIVNIQKQFEQQLQSAIAPHNARISGLLEGLAIARGVALQEGMRIIISEDGSTLVIQSIETSSTLRKVE